MASTEQPESARQRSPIVRSLARVWRWIARPHASVTEIGARRQAQLMMALALALSVPELVGILVVSLTVPGALTQNTVLAALVIICWVSYALGRTRFYRVGSVLLVVGVAASGYALSLAGSEDPSNALYSTLPLALIMASALFPLWGLVALLAATVVATGQLPMFVPGIAMTDAGRDAGVLVAIGVLLIVVTVFRNSLERTRLQDLRMANEELTAVRGTLEQRVEERTAELERRSTYMAASADVSGAASSILDSEQLIREVVDLIRERFGLYYVGLFLVDSAREWAVLRAGTGTAGQAMLARGHRLRVDEGSMIGWCITNARARVALEAGEDAVRLATAELPETRSEAALPMRSRGRVVGALTVQGDRPGIFGTDTTLVLQAMADQVAVALENASLYAESQAALEAERRAYGELSQRAWLDLLQARPDAGYVFDGGEMRPSGEEWAPEMVQAVESAMVVEGGDLALPTLTIPLTVRNQVVGVMNVAKREIGQEWTADERAFLEAVGEQLGLALEGARLYRETQQSAARERTVAEVTSRMREPLDLDDVLRTGVDEIRQALDLDQLVLRLVAADGQRQQEGRPA